MKKWDMGARPAGRTDLAELVAIDMGAIGESQNSDEYLGEHLRERRGRTLSFPRGQQAAPPRRCA